MARWRHSSGFSSALLGLGSGLLACGGTTSSEDGDGNVKICPTAFDACGGDVSGRWEMADFCVEERTWPLGPSCPGATITLQSAANSGTFEFRSDGMLVRTGTARFTEAVSAPSNCVPGGCRAFENSLLTAPTPQTTVSGACLESSATCQCTVTLQADAVEKTDPYVVSGSQVRWTNDDGDVTAYQFCQTGDDLVVRSGEAGITFRRQ